MQVSAIRQYQTNVVEWVILPVWRSQCVCVCLPDSGEFLEETGELLQTWKIQMWVFKEPGGRLEKVLAAAHV